MENRRVKVVGYAQRIFYNDGIEYRNFSDDLVGLQLASNGGTSLFSIGSFSITTNLSDKISKLFYTSNFSQYIDLKHLNLTNEDVIAILTETNKIKLNLDKSELTNYALFGSFTEYIRVSLENIILNWPASLFTTPIDEFNVSTIYPTVENYSYDNLNNISNFKISTNRIKNNFGINFLKNGSIVNSFTNTNDLRNMTINYLDYVISSNNGDFRVIGFTGSTNISNDYIYLTVEGDVFKNYMSFNVEYHIKPSNIRIEKFFNGLNDFEKYLLNRFSSPKYTSTFKYDLVSELGNVILSERNFTWPVSDGYNIDFQSDAYITYVGNLLEVSENSDLTKTNLMNRFLVSESISDFDTLPTFDNEDFTSGQKINSLLKIYGREFDDIKRYVDGIAFANVVSYDKKNNIPDALVKNFARVLGWDITSSILEIDLVNNYLSTNNSSYSGHSVSLSPIEAEVELWRRLVLNSPWLWKSKGTRKAIEFLFKFIGSPNGLITFNEFIYVAENSLDMGLFNRVLVDITDSTNIDELNIDSDGFPRIQPNNPDMYFQKAGLWYRETGGPNSKEDILYGNNPHIGPYDGGQEYINQFLNLIPNFEPVTLINEIGYNIQDNLFTNYDNGVFNDIFNNDVVTSFNVEEWYENLNTNLYNIIVEDLASNPIHPFYDTCSGTTNITMNAYLNGGLFYMNTLSGFTYSNGMVSNSANTISNFIIFLDDVLISLNSLYSTNLTNTFDGVTYNIIDDLEACGDAQSFYINKSLDIRFDVNFDYTCDGGDCNPESLDVDGVNPDTGLVYFGNVQDNIVPSGDCCTNLGYTAIAVAGGFNCYTTPTASCDDYSPSSVDNNGYIVFSGPEGSTNNVPSNQCCPIGSTAFDNNDGTYKCLSDEMPCDNYTPIDNSKGYVLFSGPNGNTNTIPQSTCCPSYSTPESVTNGFKCKIDCTPYITYTADTSSQLLTFTDSSGNTFTDFLTFDCCPTGSDAVLNTLSDGSKVYQCYESPMEVTPMISVISNTDVNDCTLQIIKIVGTPNSIVNFQITLLDTGNYGYVSTIRDDENNSYPSQPSNLKIPINLGSDGEVILSWRLCATSRVNSTDNCVELGIDFYFNNVVIFSTTSTDCDISS